VDGTVAVALPLVVAVLMTKGAVSAYLMTLLAGGQHASDGLDVTALHAVRGLTLAE
jgi:hypothetical protein